MLAIVGTFYFSTVGVMTRGPTGTFTPAPGAITNVGTDTTRCYIPVVCKGVDFVTARDGTRPCVALDSVGFVLGRCFSVLSSNITSIVVCTISFRTG